MIPFFIVTILMHLSHGFLFQKVCNDEKACVPCVTHTSWAGVSCRWCPRDGQCHAFGSIVNRCSRSEDVVTKHGCNSIVFVEYDPALAYNMVFLSALAYANVTTYIPQAIEVSSFHLVKQVTVPCSGNAHCSGYTAVSHDESAIVVAFRGTQHSEQLINEIVRVLTEPKVSFEAGGKVQSYFNDAFLLIWKELESEVDELITQHPSYKVWVTGHSLGAAIASLASTLIAYKGKTTKNNLVLYTFGQPRVGDYDYALSHDKLVPISYRVTHYRDPVVHLPTCKKVLPGTPCLSIGGGPYHHGKEIFYDSRIMTKHSLFKKCEGLPYNEDMGCSNSVLVWAKCFLVPAELKECIGDHKMYFSISVGTWWKEHSTDIK